MKIIVKRSPLMDFLSDLNGITERKTTQPILSHVFLQADDNGLTLKATDTEVSLTIQLKADELEILAHGSTTVSASKLLDVIRHQPPDALITFTLDDQEQLVVQSADHYFRLITLPAKDFPVHDEFQVNNQVLIEAKAFHQAMQKVRFSMADQDARSYLNGVFLNVVNEGQTLHLVSSDGHRLSCIGVDLDTPQPNAQLILPKKAVNELIKLLARHNELVQLEIGDRELMLKVGAYRLKTRLIDGSYPNYQQAIPERQEQPILVSRQKLSEALQRAKIVINDKTSGVHLHFLPNHAIRVFARNSANETVEEHLSGVNPTQLNLEIGLNIGYLIQAVSHIEAENLQLHVTHREGACLITCAEDPHIRYVIMSMRI